jgi:hypothetical protein
MIATLISIGYLAVFTVGGWTAVRLSRRADARADAEYAAGSLPPARPVIETEPGFNLADRDACELLLSDPEFAARCDQLWQAIRDGQQKGEQA